MTKTTHIYNLNELQDRRIMMDKKLPPYGYALIILTGFLMVYLLLWSTKNYRTYVSQSTGTVQAANKTYIMSSYSGAITELNVSEGSYVNEGDLLAHIKSTDLDMQTDSYESQLAIYKKQKSQYEKLLKSIQDDKNYFSETDPDDQPYYYQYESYKSQVAQSAFDASPYQAAGYSEEQIQALMEQNQSTVENLYYSTLQTISSNLTSIQTNIDNLQSQLDAFEYRRQRLLHLCPHLRRHPHGHALQGRHGAERGFPPGHRCQRKQRSGSGGLLHRQRPPAHPCGRPLQDRHHRPVGVLLRQSDRHRHQHRQRRNGQHLRLLLQNDHQARQHLRRQQQRR